MKKLVLLSALLFCTIVSAGENKPDITLDTTFLSRFIDKGFDCYGNNHSGIQPSLDIDLYNTGFGINVHWFRANSSGFENDERIDYKVYYYNSIFDDETYVMDYKITWMYHNFPDCPRNAANAQEIEAEFEWPELLPWGLAVRYVVSTEWPSGSNYCNRAEGGWIHMFGIGYDLSVPGLLDRSTEQDIHFSADITYNDSTGAHCNIMTSTGVDHDWSHAVFGASTEFEINPNLTFTPGLYYQLSMDDSVNNSDEFWLSLSLTHKF